MGSAETHENPTTGTLEESSILVCTSCGEPAGRLVPAYWGPLLCPSCAAEAAAELDRDGSWPTPWWEVPVPPHVAVVAPDGIWRCNELLNVRPTTLRGLGAWAESHGVTQVWVHQTALVSLGFPSSITAPRSGDGVSHPFFETRGDWLGGRSPGLKAWGYWYKRGGHGFDLHVPAYGRSVWQESPNAPHLAAHVALFDKATGGVPWKGNGTITSDAWLRRRLRRTLRPTELPPPVADGSAHEVPMVWHRPARPDERNLRYCHGLDLNLAYAAGASSLPLPTGAYTHLELPRFDPKLAGVYLVEVEGETRWVTAPTMQRLAAAGVQALEGYVWPESGRHLRAWYEMIRDARTELLEMGGPALGALKDVCREGLGRMASKVRTIPDGRRLEDDPMYQPYWAWAVIAEVRERILLRAGGVSVDPVAIDTDALYFLSSRHSPETLAATMGLPLGTGLGQFKSAGTCKASAARAALEQPRTSRALADLRELVR